MIERWVLPPFLLFFPLLKLYYLLRCKKHSEGEGKERKGRRKEEKKEGRERKKEEGREEKAFKIKNKKCPLLPLYSV